MLSSVAQWLLLVQIVVLGVAAHKDWWLQGLPDCWQKCLKNTEDGCSSRNCICKTSEDSTSYLPSAVSCAVSQCEADDWALELVLGPLQLYCSAIDCAIPDAVMESAYAVASDTDQAPSSTTSRIELPSTTVATEQTSTTGGDDDENLTSTVKTTITQTTTDNGGHTVQVIVPIIMGPTGMSTGSIVTSTLTGQASSTASPSSGAVSPSPTTPESGSTPTSSSGGSQATKPAANGNGSPFENMQAGATSWSVPASVLALGALAIFFMRL